MKYIGENAIKKLISLIKSDLNKKLDKNQGTTNSGKILGINAGGEVAPTDTEVATLVDVPNGLLKGDGTTISAAVPGVDYAVPSTEPVVTPHIGANGNWFIGDTDTGVAAEGQDGTKWFVQNSEPQTDVNTGDYWLNTGTGDVYRAGTSSDAEGTLVNWKPTGANLTGPTGATGPQGSPGKDGKSAYASAQDGGFTGTEAQFNAGLSVMGSVSGIDTTVTQNSSNIITSGAVYSYIQSLDGNGVKY